MARKKPLFKGSDWDFNTIERIADACSEVAFNELGLDTYPNQFEIITSDQMLDAYASIGLPVNYQHWSYGKKFVQEENNYRSGKSGLAYELVINSNPCINYLMEENSATLQTLVIAHAGFGHNHFFKNNYMFKEWTDADFIIDYLIFAKKYIQQCEEKYGVHEVERILDAAHALQSHGVDRYKRPSKPSIAEEKHRQKEREEYLQSQVNVLWDTIPKQRKCDDCEDDVYPKEPEENLLKFIEKNSPILEPWQREILRIVRQISQYFYPQRQTKVMNEGFACWTHDYIMNRLYDKGLLTEGAMLEFHHVHSNVVFQPTWQQSAQLNPYALGLNIFRDIQRMCQNPTDEDREWFPNLVGQNYIDVIKDAVTNYRDESFIRQFLSPKVIRDMRLFALDDADEEYYVVSNIHNRHGYRTIRKSLAESYDISNYDPNIQVVNANLNTTRRLEVMHFMKDGKLLAEQDAIACVDHLRRLWGFPVSLMSYDRDTDELYEEYESE